MPPPTSSLLKGLFRLRARQRLIPRGECHYQCFDLSRIPARERREVLTLQVSQWTPFSPAEYNIVWSGAKAQVWCWRAQPNQSSGTYLPLHRQSAVESRYYPAPEADAIELVQCRLGVEGRAWEQGVLTFSHWWPELPNSDVWINFQRASGAQPSPVTPEPLSLPPARSPWGRNAPLTATATLSWEKPAWLLLLLGFCSIMGWYGWQTYKAVDVRAKLEHQREQLEEKIDPILTARRDALRDFQAVSAIRSLYGEPSQLVQFDQIIASVPHPDRMQIVEWEYSPGSLSFILSGKSLDPSALVRAFSKLTWGRGVNAKPTKRANEMRVRLSIDASGRASDAR